MKNSTFSAQVANNLLKVLQGYTKGIRLIALLTMLCTIGVGQMWGAEETIKWNSYTSSGSGSTLTITWDGNNSCTITQSKGDNTSNNVSTSYATSPRWYQHHHVTFTPKTGCTITQVVLTGSSSSYNGQDMSFVTGTGTISKSGNATTITGSWDSTFKLKMGKQFRPGTVVVTYTTSSGGGSDPTPVDPTATFSNGEYTVGGAALDLSTLWDSNSTGAVTYSVTNAGTTGATVNGTSFTATAAGTCTVQASQAATATHNAATATATITVTAPAGGGGGEGECSWVETAISSIKSTDIVVITMTNNSGSTYAMSNDNGTNSAPTATNVTVSGTTLTGTIADNLKWNISNNNGTLTIYPNETTNTWLYCTSTNNGVRVGTNTNKTFTIDASSGYLKHTGTSRYLGVYNNADWRCYTNTTGNTANQTLKFYVYKCDGGGGDDPEPEPDPVDPEVTFSDGEYTVGGAALNLSTLLTTNSTGAVTYSVIADGGTGAIIEGSTFTATAAGTCRIQASIANTTYYNAATATANIIVTAPATVEGTWTLVTNAANLKAGDRIVIAAAESDFALSTTQNTNNRGQAAVTKDDNIIKFTEFTQIITLEAGIVDNTLAFNTGAGYLYAASSSSNHLKTQDTKNENGSWSISIDGSTGVATVVAQGENTNNTLFYNQSSKLFSCYANTATQKAIAIYKEGGGTTTYTITSTLSHVTADGGNPTTITSEDTELELSYSADTDWNLPENITITMGSNELTDSEYVWDNANGDLLIQPTSGFTGNIVVTINGWQQLAAPTGLNVTNITSTSATLSWDEVANASSYLVTIVDGGDLSADIPNTQTSHTFEGLTPSTEYLWTVKAIGDGITYTNSEESETAEFTTPAAAAPTAGYTIIHSRQALDDSYPDSLIVKTTGTADVGSKITAEKKTYTGFVCNDAEQTITIQEDAAQNVVTYKYVRQSYTLTWDLDGGNIIEEGTPAGTVKYGAPLTAPTVEKAGYRFDHWNPNVPTTMQDGNRTYKAFYTQQHTVKWVSQGTVIRTDIYDTGAALEAAPTTGIVECDGKNHVGWTAQGGYAHSTAAPADLFTESSGTVTADATYYAVYAEGSGSGGTGWTAVTSTSDLEAGATYAISNAATGGTYLSTWDGGNNFDGSTITICHLILGGSEGAWTFQISDESTHNNKYLTATSAASNRLKAVNPVDEWSYFTISFDGNAAVITCTGKNTNNILRYNANNGSPIFACYSSGQSDVYLQKQTGGGGYTNYTTSCATITGIRIEGETTEFNQFDPFEFGGKVYAIDDEDNETDVTELATFTGYDMSQAGTQTVTVRYSGCSVTYEITVNKLPVWNITWSVGGKTNTGIGPREVVQGKTIGECSSTGDLQTPSVDCEGKVFMGWTESNTVPTDGVGIAYIDKNTKPDSDKTYYAVFATKEVGDGVALTQCNGSTAFEAGDKIVIVASGADWSYLCYQETSGTTYIVNHEFVNNATTLINDDKNYWTLETANGGFYLGDVTNGYMYLPSSNDLCVDKTNKSIWTIEWDADTCAFNIKSDRWLSCRSDLSTANKYKWRGGGTDGASGTTNLQIYKISGSTSYTDYSTSCGTYTVTFYGFNSGGYTTTCDDNPAEIAVAQGETYQIPDCEPTFDPAGLGRTFAGTWNTQADGKGTTYEPGNEFTVNSDITLYAQWALNTSGNTTLPTDVEDLATTDIIVTGGTTLTLQAGTTTINSLTLKGGLIGDGKSGNYAMPSVWVPEGATLVRNNNKINLDLKVNNNSYYPFAVPFEVANTSANVNYINTTLKEYANANNGYGKYYRILEYNGAGRADNGVHEDNWVHVGRTDVKLMPGKGYAISAVPAAGDDTVTIRITMTVDNAWLADGEQESITVKEQTTTRNKVTVTAHTGPATDINNGGHQRHAGWNFVANPYLSKFAGNNVANDVEYIKGSINIQNEYTYEDTEVTYVTVPAHDFSYYEQFKLSTTKLSPAYSFFVQVGESGTMTFETAGRQQAPASIAARNAEERPVKMDVDITLSDNHSSDQTGIIISDRYSDAYEIGRDLEKLFGSAYNLSVYTLMADNTPLAFQALAIRSSMQVIPVGYRAPEQGEYTFRLNEATSSIDLLNEQYEQLVLVDYQTGELTNLLISDYTFYSERTQADNRFAIYAVPRQNAPTDLPNAIGQDKQAQKIIHNGHLYILRDGNVYNGNGQIVK